MRPRRWGIIELLFLGPALSGVVGSAAQGHYTVVTLLAVTVGLLGAATATVRGVMTMYAAPPARRAAGRSHH